MGDPFSTAALTAALGMGGKVGGDALSRMIFGNRFPAGAVNPAGAGTPPFTAQEDQYTLMKNLQQRLEEMTELKKLLEEMRKQEQDEDKSGYHFMGG
jgi:hypothetical protein